MAELVGTYLDLPLGIVDAAVIAIAERLGLTEVATVDHRHFSVVRPRHSRHSHCCQALEPPDCCPTLAGSQGASRGVRGLLMRPTESPQLSRSARAPQRAHGPNGITRHTPARLRWWSYWSPEQP
jgi:hypothetical protein